MQSWLLTEGRTRTPAPFGVHFSVGVPSDTIGNNGDFAFCYGNDGLGIFKKIAGTWIDVSASGRFSGFNNRNSQLIELVANAAEVTVTNFTFTDNDGLQVEVDGIVQYEGDAFSRDSANSKILFSETILASASNPVNVFVGAYTGTGFVGFNSNNSELFEVTTDVMFVDVTNFVMQATDPIRVEIDGITKYEGSSNDWTRDIDFNRISFNETISASGSSPVKIFVGKYN